MLIKFTIPLTPITKKNHQRILKSRRTGGRYVAPSEQFKQYEEMALWYIPKRGEPINFPVCVKCTFFMPDNRRCDLTNHLESVDDIMVAAGLLADDNYTILVSHDGSRVKVDKQNPRTEVEIFRMEEL